MNTVISKTGLSYKEILFYKKVIKIAKNKKKLLLKLRKHNKNEKM